MKLLVFKLIEKFLFAIPPLTHPVLSEHCRPVYLLSLPTFPHPLDFNSQARLQFLCLAQPLCL